MSSTTELLLEWDRRRPRTLQREIGFSDIGSCRRRVGYRLSGLEPTNAAGSVQAAMGSAIHDAIHDILLELEAPGVTAETEVTFAGIKGHYDRTEGDELIDVKTTSVRFLEHIRLHGPEHRHIWQVNLYAAALIMNGHEIKRVRIDYLARDSGEEFQWRGRFDPRHVRDALEWLKLVRDTPVDLLPRDYAPDTTFCQGCPYLSVCWDGAIAGRDLRSVLFVEDPDAAKWMRQLWDARIAGKEADRLADEAKGALSAIKPFEANQRVAAGEWEIAWNVRGVLRFTATPDDVKTGAA